MTYLALVANSIGSSSQAGYFPSVLYVLTLFSFVVYISWLVCALIVKFVYFIYMLFKIKRGSFSPGSTSYTFQTLPFIKDSIYVVIIGVVTYGMTWAVFLSLVGLGIDISRYLLIDLVPNVGVLMIYAFISLALSAVLYGLWLGKRVLPIDLAVLRRLGLLKNIPSTS